MKLAMQIFINFKLRSGWSSRDAEVQTQQPKAMTIIIPLSKTLKRRQVQAQNMNFKLKRECYWTSLPDPFTQKRRFL